ncbi:MAG: transketolase C-terminal domain-containing protein, partial [Candidatus Bipolaricaulia bacterium]
IRVTVTGLAHDEEGFPVEGAKAGEQLQRIVNRIEEEHREEIVLYEERYLDDAEQLIISYGTPTRAAEAAVEELRRAGVRVGLLDLKTLWPFPNRLIRRLAERVSCILVPELNMGQMVLLVRMAAEGAARVRYLGRVDGNLIFPYEIYDAVMKEAHHA